MKKEFKTSKKNRTSYIYYDANGKKVMELIPGENGVTEADIELLHSMDDAEIDEQRRYDYRVTANLHGFYEGEEDISDDRNKYLADDAPNPEEFCLAKEADKEYQSTLGKLSEAMNYLLPQQIELFKKVYLDKRTYTDIAKEEGVSEAAIRNRLKKMHEKLKKNFL